MRLKQHPSNPISIKESRNVPDESVTRGGGDEGGRVHSVVARHRSILTGY